MNGFLYSATLLLMAGWVSALEIVECSEFNSGLPVRNRFERVYGGGILLTGGEFDYTSSRAELGMMVILDSELGEISRILFTDSELPYAVSACPISDGRYIVLVPGTSYDTDYRQSIAEIDTDGSIAWLRMFEGEYSHGADIILECSDRGYLIGGTLPSDAFYMKRAWLLKVDSHGDVEWQHVYSEDSGSTLTSVISCGDGYVFAGARDGGEGETNAWACRVDRNGEVIWERMYAGEGFSRFNSVGHASGGGFIFSGYCSPITSPHAGYIVRSDAEGAEVWNLTVQPRGGNHQYYFYDALELADGSCVAVGNAFEGGLASCFDGLVAHVSPDGVLDEMELYGEEGECYDLIFDVYESDEGEIILTGRRDADNSRERVYWRLLLII